MQHRSTCFGSLFCSAGQTLPTSDMQGLKVLVLKYYCYSILKITSDLKGTHKIKVEYVSTGLTGDS